MKTKILVLCLLFTGIFVSATGGNPDTTLNEMQRNVIRYNVTAPLLFGFKNVVIGYERVLKPNRSFSVTLGHRSLPPLLKSKENQVFDYRDHRTKNGFSFNADYRFYIKSRAIAPAPDGFYIAPFINVFHIDILNDIILFDNKIITNEAAIDANIFVAGIGCKIGYQMRLGKHFFLDMTFLGPSYSYYKATAIIDAKVEGSNDEIAEIIRDLIIGIFPGLGNLMTTQTLETSGTLNTLGLGFHYSVNLGYAF